MKVIQVNKFHYLKGGAERYYLDVSEQLKLRGHDVRFLAMAHERNEAAAPGDKFVEEVDYRGGMGPLAKVRHAWQAIYNRDARNLAAQLADEAVGASGPDPGAAADGPTVVHLHNIYHQLSPSVIDGFKSRGLGVVQTLHDYKLVCPAYLLMTEGQNCERCMGGRYYEAIAHRCLLGSRAASAVGTIEAYLHSFRGTYDKIDRFLCPSRFLLEKVAEFGIPHEKLVHLPYLVHADRFVPGEGPSEGYAVYIGRLSREKGIGTLIEAMTRLPRESSLRLKILGEGPLREQLEAKVRELCPDRIEFLGFRSGEELHETIRRAAFAVVPSEWYENLPFAVLEPFALGTPVLGARIGGIPEMVEPGQTGQLYESADPESLTDALLWMAGPGADLEQMGMNARRRIEKDYSVDQHLERLIAIYQNVAEGIAI